MKATQKGSCVLVILTIMSMLLMLGLATYKSATFFEQFSLVRIAHEQQALLTRSLLEYGILTVTRNYQKVVERTDPWSLHLETVDYRGTIKVSKTAEGIVLCAVITEPQKGNNMLTCLITQESDGKIQVRGFQRG